MKYLRNVNNFRENPVKVENFVMCTFFKISHQFTTSKKLIRIPEEEALIFKNIFLKNWFSEKISKFFDYIHIVYLGNIKI